MKRRNFFRSLFTIPAVVSVTKEAEDLNVIPIQTPPIQTFPKQFEMPKKYMVSSAVGFYPCVSYAHHYIKPANFKKMDE